MAAVGAYRGVGLVVEMINHQPSGIGSSCSYSIESAWLILQDASNAWLSWWDNHALTFQCANLGA